MLSEVWNNYLSKQVSGEMKSEQPSKEFLDAIENLGPIDEYYRELIDARVQAMQIAEQISKAERKYKQKSGDSLDLWGKGIPHELRMQRYDALEKTRKIEEANKKLEQVVHDIGAKEGLPYHVVCEYIRKRNPRQAPCLGGCGTMLTVYSKYEEQYEAKCENCKLNEEKAKWEETQQHYKHKSELNPLIRYCHEINNQGEWWDISFEQKKTHENQRWEGRSALLDERMEELKYIARDYKKQLPYNPSRGMSEEEWWKQVERKRREIKERDKQQELDSQLRTKSPTWQILEKLEVVRFDGCKCKAELMRQGQFCPACRLMVKVHEYALRLFKDAAQGRASDGDMSITR
jgi:hypothetical protein